MKPYFWIFLVYIPFLVSCSLVNSNHKIAGKYALYLKPTESEKNGGLGNFIGKTILKDMLQSDVEFTLDGKANLNLDLFGMNIGDKDGTFLYHIEGDQLTLSTDEDDTITFEMIKTEEGYKLQNEDVTFYLKQKAEE